RLDESNARRRPTRSCPARETPPIPPRRRNTRQTVSGSPAPSPSHACPGYLTETTRPMMGAMEPPAIRTDGLTRTYHKPRKRRWWWRAKTANEVGESREFVALDQVSLEV